MTVRVRFAPSPTGHLHVGNVRTALYNWLFSRQKGGTFILRVEDTDLARSERHFEEQLKEDLRWLDLMWTEGVDVQGDHGPYRQTERFDLYQAYAEQLLSEDKAYYCFCSTEELEQERQRRVVEGQSPQYSGKCRTIPTEEARRRVQESEKATLRLRVRRGTAGFEDVVFGPLQIECSEIGDFVLLRSDGSAPYNFACVVDDVLMKITHVIRGEGHISNTYRQVLIYEAFGFKTPHFAHLSTILGKDGAKLSKRHGATSIDEFRQQGYLSEALVNYLALLGWAPREEGHEILAVEQLIAEFDLSRVNRSPATFDWEKLNWVNRSHLKRVDRPRLTQLAIPYLQRPGWIPSEPSQEVRQWIADVVETVFKYLDKLEDVAKHAQFIFEFNPERSLSEPDVEEVLAEDGAVEVIREFHSRLQGHESLDLEAYERIIAEVRTTTGRKGKNLFHPIRVALTAQSKGPELHRLVSIFQKGSQLGLPVKVLAIKERVDAVLEHLQ